MLPWKGGNGAPERKRKKEKEKKPSLPPVLVHAAGFRPFTSQGRVQKRPRLPGAAACRLSSLPGSAGLCGLAKHARAGGHRGSSSRGSGAGEANEARGGGVAGGRREKRAAFPLRGCSLAASPRSFTPADSNGLAKSPDHPCREGCQPDPRLPAEPGLQSLGRPSPWAPPPPLRSAVSSGQVPSWRPLCRPLPPVCIPLGELAGL